MCQDYCYAWQDEGKVVLSLSGKPFWPIWVRAQTPSDARRALRRRLIAIAQLIGGDPASAEDFALVRRARSPYC